MATTIGIFDSGIGGLSVLRELRREIPSASYIYYADSANCPYGVRDTDFIRRRAIEITGELIARGAGLVVIACNTATAAAIATLRSRYPDIPFVGMEPAIKPAVALTRTGIVGVLATASTLKSGKYLSVKARHTPDSVTVVEHSGDGYVELVERGMLSGAQAAATVAASLDPLTQAGADVIVLGCTHYPFLLPLMRQQAPEGTVFIDPAPAVARRVRALLPQGASDGSGGITLLSSGDIAPLERITSTYIL